MFGQISTPDIENELRRRGIYTEAALIPTPVVTPTPFITPFITPEISPIIDITPFIPESPATPVLVLPGEPPIYREPVIPPVIPPYISPEIEVPERDLWLPGGPPTRVGEAKLSKTALIAGGVILAAIIIFTAEPAPGKRPGKKKPVLRRRTTREEFRPARTEAM